MLTLRNMYVHERAKHDLFYYYNLSSNDVNCELSRFLLWLNSVLNKYFPIKTKNISLKRIKTPWLSNDILKLINKKHKLFIAVKKKLYPYNAYRAYCDLLKILINKSKIYYMKSKFSSLKHDSKKL